MLHRQTYLLWIRRGASNSVPIRTKDELFPLSYSGVEARDRNDLSTEGYESSIFPTKLTRHGADGGTRSLFSGLEDQGTAYIPRPLTALLIQMSKNKTKAPRVSLPGAVVYS